MELRSQAVYLPTFLTKELQNISARQAKEQNALFSHSKIKCLSPMNQMDSVLRELC